MLELGFSIEHNLHGEGYNNRHELGIANGSRSTCFFLSCFVVGNTRKTCKLATYGDHLRKTARNAEKETSNKKL